MRLEDYTLDFIPDCVSRVQEVSGEADVNIVGYCMGGVLSTVYGALHAEGPDEEPRVFTTPIDFSEMKLFQRTGATSGTSTSTGSSTTRAMHRAT